MSVALIVLLPFLGAILPALMIRAGRDSCAISTLSINILSLALLLTHAPTIFRGEAVLAHWDWLPRLGLNVSFSVDGLSLLFAFMILAIGTLVIIYARFYLSRNDRVGAFYCYLLLFQGAMVGVVLSHNALLMLIFWELTSLSSFLLIGFWNHLPAGRQGARMALTITGGGGLALIAGILLLGGLCGSYDFSVIAQSRETIQQASLYPIVLVFVLIGCFTKSAQFPFHFWLPHAMAAPTPVSAYLHSATMVKAGIYVMARLWPALSGTDLWFSIVATTGLVTMIVGAVIAILQVDLKGLLAYSTISHLGLITMLLGFGTRGALAAGILHIMNHAAFKAALFMNAGIVDHEAGTRDLRSLGGLRRAMPLTALLGSIAACAMAGLPPLNGFISKELMLEETVHLPFTSTRTFFVVVATIAAAASVAYSWRYLMGTFLGSCRSDASDHSHDPPVGLWGPSAVLVILAIVGGLASDTVMGEPLRIVVTSLTGTPSDDIHLGLWHGMTPALALSIAAILGGLVIYMAAGRRYVDPKNVWTKDGKALFESGIGALLTLSSALHRRFHYGRLQLSVLMLIVTSIGVVASCFFQFRHSGGNRPLLEPNAILFLCWFLVVGASVLIWLKHQDRLMALILVNVIGLISTLAFVYLSAPDLALTQISVEVVTLVLMLLALYFLPKQGDETIGTGTKYRDGAIAGLAGLGMGLLSWMVMTRDTPSLSHYYIENAYTGGGGKNVVNVILVDFRGFDTFGEIMVLGIAALSIFAILEGMLRGSCLQRVERWMPEFPKSPNRHPLMMVVITRVMLPLSLMVGAFIFLRGHNLPGGGFIAALVVSIALVMQYMASGFQWAADQVRFDYHALIGAGGLIAAATGVGAMVLDLPFLTSGFTHVHWPIVGEFEITSAMFFDAGVFLTVVGAVMLALAQLSLLGSFTQDYAPNDRPMDFDPALYKNRQTAMREERKPNLRFNKRGNAGTESPKRDQPET